METMFIFSKTRLDKCKRKKRFQDEKAFAASGYYIDQDTALVVLSPNCTLQQKKFILTGRIEPSGFTLEKDHENWCKLLGPVRGYLALCFRTKKVTQIIKWFHDVDAVDVVQCMIAHDCFVEVAIEHCCSGTALANKEAHADYLNSYIDMYLLKVFGTHGHKFFGRDVGSSASKNIFQTLFEEPTVLAKPADEELAMTGAIPGVVEI